MRRVFQTLLLVLSVAPAAFAQLRGTVHDVNAGITIVGAVITAIDSAGANRGRAITDTGGRFSIALTPSASKLRVVRIGYRPVEFSLAGDRSVPIAVVMTHLPPMLELIRISGSKLCPGSTETGAAFQLWEQARSGLLATVVARELNPAQARILTYSTHLAPNDLLVLGQTKKIQTGRTTRPFVSSAQPSFFATAGYLNETRESRVFNAPDADVLVDESFAATHCFSLRQPDTDHQDQVGVAFTPIGGRDTLVDVDGVIWLDAKTPQLRSLDFRYTSLERAAMEANSGGHIEFQLMPNGVAFIDTWYMRLADLEQAGTRRTTASTTTTMGPQRRADRNDLHVRELVDGGGTVLDAAWPDGTRYMAPRSSVSGVVAWKGTGTPAAGVVVDLAGTPDVVTTDRDGRFRIETIPGRYRVEAADTSLSSFVAWRTQSTPVEIRPGADAVARLELPPLQKYMDDLCKGTPVPPGAGMVAGAVKFAGTPETDAILMASFQDPSTRNARQSMVTSNLDRDGRFALCGVPRDRKVYLRLQTPLRVLGDTAVILSLRGVGAEVLWRLRQP